MNDLVRHLFDELVQLSPVEREGIFAERRIAPELRAEVETLLSFDLADDDSLTDRVSRAATEALRFVDRPDLRQCGPYRLVRLLGSGGMGAVYAAERSDGEIQQRVAVKLLRAGADRPSWHERFLKERQLLAYLNHPSIVHLLDAGHTSDGRPYLAMEYVDGVAIDAYAADKDLRDQLTLFLSVCDAVAHAHRHLIIHRDLKPSNILVDASGQPKLLDFGIAKLLDETAGATETAERLLTPNYASPEQVRGANQTTATDVYSLGAVLYKLLTGRSPHESDAQISQALEVVAGTRQIPAPSRLNPRLPSDIDYMLRKALRYEPEERYASVEAFANDVRAFLDQRPVQARSGDTWYRTRKFLRRHWLPVSAAALAVISLSAGLWIANRERTLAQMRFAQVRELAGHLIFDLHDEIRNVPGATRARDKLASTAVEYLDSLAQDAGSDLDLAWELLNAYDRLSKTRGGVGANLGRTEEALKLSEKVVRLAENLEARGSLDAERRRRLFIVYDELARMYRDLRRKPEAEAMIRNLLRLGPDLAPVHQSQAFAGAAEYEEVFGSAARALELCEAAVRVMKDVPEEQPTSVVQITRAGALLSVGRVRARFGLLEESLEAYRATLPFYEAALRADPQHALARRNLYLGRLWMGDVLASDDRFNLGRLDEAEEHFRAAIALAENMHALDPKNEAASLDLARASGKLGSALHQSRPAESLALMDRAHVLLTGTSLGNSSAAEMQLAYLLESARPLLRLGRLAEAQTNVQTAVSLLEKLRGQNPTRNWTANQLAIHTAESQVFEALGDYPKALAAVNEEMALIEYKGVAPETLGDDYPLVNALERIVSYGLHADRGGATTAQKRLVQIWSRWSERLPDSRYVADRLKRAQAQLAVF
jgi:serine/threonine protein kinase